MIVVKLGGAALKHTLSDPRVTALLAQTKEPLLIVHGGGPEISSYCEKLGLESSFVEGQRVTSPEVFGVVEMALARIGNALVRGLRAAGRDALALNGQSLGIFSCDEEDPRLGRVGRVRDLRTDAFTTAFAAGWIPVLAPLGVFVAGTPAAGEGCNINADLAASIVASKLKADRLVFFTDRDGILDSRGSVIRDLGLDELRALAASPVISGGMKVKARAIVEAIEAHPACRVQVVNGINLDLFESVLDGRDFGTTIRG